MRYEWDEVKNLRNQRKHGGVSFELGTLAFEDERCLVCPDRVDRKTKEQRWHAIGAAQIEDGAAVLLVVHVIREDDHGEEIIRIPERAATGISARAAEKHKIRRYQEQRMD